MRVACSTRVIAKTATTSGFALMSLGSFLTCFSGCFSGLGDICRNPGFVFISFAGEGLGVNRMNM